MSTDAERAAAKKVDADQKAAEEATASDAATTNWRIEGYNNLILLLFLFVLAVLPMCVDVASICVVRAYLDRNQYVVNFVNAMFMIIPWIKLIKKLPIYSAIFNRVPPVFLLCICLFFARRFLCILGAVEKCMNVNVVNRGQKRKMRA